MAVGLKTKVLNFAGQGLLAFSPAVIVAYLSHHSATVSASLSVAFAAAGVCFSIMYMGQRAYVSILGTSDSGKEFCFRFFNSLIAAAGAMAMSFLYGASPWLFFLAIAIKLSEAFIDLRNGVDIFTLGVGKASKKLFLSSLIRAIFVLIPFFVVDWASLNSYFLFVSYYLCLSLVVLVVVSKVPNSGFGVDSIRKYTLNDYIQNVSKLKKFSVATICCAILSSAPRLLLDVQVREEVSFLIAFSAAPAIAVLYQAIWLSVIDKVKKQPVKGFLVFLSEVVVVYISLILTKGMWSKLVPIFYGVTGTGFMDDFIEAVIAMSGFFGVMTTMNIFKFKVPWLESLSYTASLLVLVVCSSILGLHIIDAIYASSITMLIVLATYVALNCSLSILKKA